MSELRRSSGTRAPSLLQQIRRIEREGGDGALRFPDGRTLPVRHLQRLVFPKAGVTKGALMAYYVRMAEVVVPVIADRALVLTRHPAGVGGPSFHQHDPGDEAPDAVDVAMLPTADDRPARRMIGSLGSLLHAIQLGAVGVDAWHSRVGSVDTPDYAVLDLDPSPEAPADALHTLAWALREEMAHVGRDAVLKTSGSRGLHLLVPLEPGATYDESAALAESLALAVVARYPGLATVVRGVDDRPAASVYVDHLQNARGKTLAIAFGARARERAPVSTPLRWDELTPSLDLHRVTVASAPDELGDLRRRWREAWAMAALPGAWAPG